MENRHIPAVLRQVRPGVTLTKGYVRIGTIGDEFAAALDLACVVVEAYEGVRPSAFAQIHTQKPNAATNVKQGQWARFEFAKNPVVEWVGPQFAGDVVTQPRAVAQG